MKKLNFKSILEKLKFRIWLFNVGVIMLLSSNNYSQTIARQSISSYGSTSSADGHSYSQTVGQSYNTKSLEGINLTQGFLQPVSYKIEKVIQDNIEALDISVYPNPAHHSVNLKSSSVLKEAFIVISNIHGNIIYEQKIQSVKEHIINCSLWATGIYIIKIQDDSNKQSVSKLIISN